MEYAFYILIIGGIVALYLKKDSVTEDTSEEDKKKISELEQTISAKEENIKNLQNNSEVLNAKMNSFEQKDRNYNRNHNIFLIRHTTIFQIMIKS